LSIVFLKNEKPTVLPVGFSLSKKSFLEFQTKSFLIQQFFQKCWRNPKAEPLVAHRSERKSPVEGAFTRGELTKQPGGLFFKRGRFARKSVPLLSFLII